ncbi:MAG: rhodanese-like domain-containing protein [Lacrimispora celerecrescens]|nr:rhodanese-like domain-containing protein [Lacrimispora celerecrescens]
MVKWVYSVFFQTVRILLRELNLPLDRLESMKLDKSNPVFVYCQSGARSGQACRYLWANGYSVTDIGGISAYRGILEKG